MLLKLIDFILCSLYLSVELILQSHTPLFSLYKQYKTLNKWFITHYNVIEGYYFYLSTTPPVGTHN